MIHLTRLNHAPLVLNSDLIEHMEVTPDTVVTLTTGQKIVVLESAEEVMERVIQFRRSINSGAAAWPPRRMEPEQPDATKKSPGEING